MKCGISTLHGPHHVAQKSSSTTFPLKSARVTFLPATSFIVKLRFAGFASAGQDSIGAAALSPRSPSAAVPAGRSTIVVSCLASHGICVVTVNAASAATPTMAMTQRMRIRTAPSPSTRLQRAMDERGQPLDFCPRLARHEHERAIADRPDGRFVAEDVDQLVGFRGAWEHEEGDRMAVVA